MWPSSGAGDRDKLIGEEATPSRIIWIVAGEIEEGVSGTTQDGFTREIMIEEAARPASFRWTMHGTSEQVEKGEFDDHEDMTPTQGVKRSRIVRVFLGLVLF